MSHRLFSTRSRPSSYARLAWEGRACTCRSEQGGSKAVKCWYKPERTAWTFESLHRLASMARRWHLRFPSAWVVEDCALLEFQSSERVCGCGDWPPTGQSVSKNPRNTRNCGSTFGALDVGSAWCVESLGTDSPSASKRPDGPNQTAGEHGGTRAKWASVRRLPCRAKSSPCALSMPLGNAAVAA